jgi:hypothetical protein
VLAIPNRPFSGKPIKLVAGKNPPDGDYRLPLTEGELELLRRVVPELSIRVVDSTPELPIRDWSFFCAIIITWGIRAYKL